jgi:hypothetical protein
MKGETKVWLDYARENLDSSEKDCSKVFKIAKRVYAEVKEVLSCISN